MNKRKCYGVVFLFIYRRWGSSGYWSVPNTSDFQRIFQSFSNLCANSILPNVKKSSVKKLLKVYVFLLLVYQRRGLSMIFPSARLIFVFYDYSYFSYNFHVTDVKIQIMRTIYEIII